MVADSAAVCEPHQADPHLLVHPCLDISMVCLLLRFFLQLFSAVISRNKMRHVECSRLLFCRCRGRCSGSGSRVGAQCCWLRVFGLGACLVLPQEGTWYDSLLTPGKEVWSGTLQTAITALTHYLSR